MGEVQGTLFPLRFNRSLQVLATSALKVTGDAGVVVLREIGQRLGLWRLLEKALGDYRDQDRITHPFIELLRTAILVPAQGWFSQRDVDLLRDDPVFRLAVSKRRGDGPLHERSEGERVPAGLASQATLSRLMADLSTPENRAALPEVMCSWVAHREGLTQRRVSELTLDLDSVPIEVHGHQPGSAWNGHYEVRCFHPLVLTCEFGDFLGGMLREGNVYTSADALGFLLPYMEWASGVADVVWARIDAGFPEEEFLSGVESNENRRYVARLRSNSRLEAMAKPHVDEIVAKGEKREEQLHCIELGLYEAKYAKKKWSRARRVVLIIDERPSELLPHWFFLVTNATVEEQDGQALLARYRKRGLAEKEFGEWQNSLNLALSSTNRTKSSYLGEAPKTRSEPVDSFAVNEATLLLSMVTANLLHVGRLLAGRAMGRAWSRHTFRQMVLKVAGRITRSSRYVKLWIEETRAEQWSRIAEELDKLPTARGSPRLMALPSPA